MNKTYVAMTMNNQALNVGTIYFTDAFLANDVVNPATQARYTEEEKKGLEVTSLEAPVNGCIAISSLDTGAVLWFDAESAAKIVSHADALIVNGRNMITTNGQVVAVAL